MNLEAEIRDLKRRVGELEGGFSFLTNQVRDVHRDLLGFQQQTEAWQQKADQQSDRVEARLNSLETKVEAIPRALAEVVHAEFERRRG